MKAIEFENIGKQYRLGLVSTGTIKHDLNRWWTMNVLHKEDPYLKIGETNDRSQKGHSEYVWALKNINFSVEQGDVVGIIGQNGAGKSTLLKLLSRVTTPTTGTIRVRGRIASLLEVGTGFHPEMTGRENIYMNGAIMGMTKAEITRKLDEIIDFSGCERYIDTPVKRYSSGMTVRLGFAVAAHLDPEILVVDEVLAVGDAEFQKKAIGKMQDVSKGEGRTVLFVSHNMSAVKSLCKSGFLIEKGEIVFSGDAVSTVKKYLGLKISHFTTFKISDSTNRRYNVTKDLEIFSARMHSPAELAQDEPIEVELEIKRNLPSVKKFTIEMMIENIEEQKVGSYISPVYVVPNKDMFRITMSVPNHNLARGKYFLDFNIGLKDENEFGFRDYDMVFNMLNFEVKYIDKETKRLIQVWRDNWGTLHLRNADIVIE